MPDQRTAGAPPARTAIAARNTYLDALMHLADGGCIRIYTGPQPETPETPASGTLLATGTLPTPAFVPAVDGIASATGVEGWIDEDGVPGWFRVFQADGVTPVWDGTCGTADANLLFDSVPLVAGARLTFSAFVHAAPIGVGQ